MDAFLASWNSEEGESERARVHGMRECAHTRMGVFVRCGPDRVQLSSPALLPLLLAPSTSRHSRSEFS